MRRRIREYVERMNAIPTIPAIVRPLLHYLSKPVEQLEIHRIVEMVSCDESVAAHCLRVANSALYYRPRPVKTVHGAVVALGVRQVSQILLMCSLVDLLPKERWLVDPVVFWEHSLACALVGRYLAQKSRHREEERVYLAGLLHDLGELVNMMVVPSEFRAALETGIGRQLPLHEAEKATMGFTHCETGEIVARYWRLPEDVVEAIQYHHDVQQARLYPTQVATVGFADLVCRLLLENAQGLGSGYQESGLTDIFGDPSWAILLQASPRLQRMDAAAFSLQLNEFMKEVQSKVASVFRT